MLEVAEVHVIRHKVLVEGRSQRQVALEMGVSRNTVRKYRDQSEPRRVETGPRPTPVRDRVRGRIEDLILEWRDRVTPKQRLTGSRIHRQLLDEGFEVGITTVRDYLRERRRRQAEVFVPLVHRPGDEAQVDFFEVVVDVGDVRRKAWMFLMRLMYSGRAFAHFGGVP